MKENIFDVLYNFHNVRGLIHSHFPVCNPFRFVLLIFSSHITFGCDVPSAR